MECLLGMQNVADLTGWRPLTIYKKAAGGEIPARVRIEKRALLFRKKVGRSPCQALIFL